MNELIPKEGQFQFDQSDAHIPRQVVNGIFPR
jgi:hypothetical protein